MKPTTKNHTVVGWKTDHCWCASVLVMGKLIPIGLVINLEKNRTDQTMHTPTIELYPSRFRFGPPNLEDLLRLGHGCARSTKKEFICSNLNFYF